MTKLQEIKLRKLVRKTINESRTQKLYEDFDPQQIKLKKTDDVSIESSNGQYTITQGNDTITVTHADFLNFKRGFDHIVRRQ